MAVGARLSRFVWAATVCAVLSACAGIPGGMTFVEDTRLTFLAPERRSQQSLPVTVTWEMEDFRVVGPGQAEPSRSEGYYAVFVNRAPVRPGRSLEDVVGRDEACRRRPGCPDERYFAERGVYTTIRPTFTVDRLPRHSPDGPGDLHEVTIVLLDTDGLRIGEVGWTVQFTIDRGTRP